MYPGRWPSHSQQGVAHPATAQACDDFEVTNRRPQNMTNYPPRQGLYDPQFEHDACGVAFVADAHGRASRDIVEKGIQALVNLDHRGAAGAEKNTGDGAGILIQVMDIARRFHLEIPPQLMLLLKTLVHVEGLGTDLYPQLDIWKLAKPILTEWVKANMNPVKNVKEIGQQIPDLLLGAQDLPSLLIDSLNGLKNQSAWHDKQLKEIQQMRLQMQQQQRRSWMFGSTMLIMLTIAIISPWFISIVLIVLSSLLALWRMTK